MRATIDTTNGGEVVLCYDHHVTGSRVRRVFQVSRTGYGVNEVYPDASRSTVRKYLATFAYGTDPICFIGLPALSATVSTLKSVVRREYRAMRRAEAR